MDFTDAELVVIHEALLAFQYELSLADDRSLELTRRTVWSALNKTSLAVTGQSADPVVVKDDGDHFFYPVPA